MTKQERDCSRKRRFLTKQDCVRIMIDSQAHLPKKKQTRRPLEPYKCAICDLWHAASIKAKAAD